ncbi:response regulator [Mucilaginibacter sp. HMF5004]|uniref:response regulator n=1 Tax=Mucilaginibacter rivuli TaxID=2857527 RepID=UPI001C606140|nr:response regulator [Mucilaginibacter rivuli]MBW4891240.1 response regulator [Mucilaginibacter rivuli]
MLTLPYKVLLLEDNKSDADLTIRELKKGGLSFEHQIVETREDFENALQNFSPDIIISDYSLPSFDGLSAFIIMQEKYPEIPFIIISGMLGEQKAVELIKSGITDYTIKDKLFTLPPKVMRALRDVEEHNEKKIADAELKLHHDKLHEIAFLQSHQVRVPIAQILGLFSLFKFDDPYNPVNAEVLQMLQATAQSFDTLIHDIVEKTTDIRKMH